MGCDEDDRHLPICGGKVALKLKTASPRHSHVEHQASGALRRIGLEKIGNRRKLPGHRRTVRNSRTTESRNSGSSSMIKTLGFASPIPGIPKASAFFPPWFLILRTIRWFKQHLLPKRIAQGLSHRLGAPALHYWGMSLTLQLACSAKYRANAGMVERGSCTEADIDPHTRIYRRR